MLDPQTYGEGMAEATLILLLRAGLLDPDDVATLADEYDRRAGWESRGEAREALEQTAHGLRLALLSTDEAPDVDPTVEARAQFQRQQMRQRTAMLEGPADEA